LTVAVSGLSFCLSLSFISLNSWMLFSVVCIPRSLIISPYSEQNADSASAAIGFELFIIGCESNCTLCRRRFFYNPGSVFFNPPTPKYVAKKPYQFPHILHKNRQNLRNQGWSRNELEKLEMSWKNNTQNSANYTIKN
jgi:hypothetical protein